MRSVPLEGVLLPVALILYAKYFRKHKGQSIGNFELKGYTIAAVTDGTDDRRISDGKNILLATNNLFSN